MLFRSLQEANVSNAEIDEVILAGRTTNMPKIIQTVKAIFGKEPQKCAELDEVFVMGAAIQAGFLQLGAAEGVERTD